MTRREALKPPAATAQSPAWTVAAIMVIVVATAAAYSNSFHGAFIFDDIKNIARNDSIRSLRSTAVLLTPGRDALGQRPLANVTLAINYAIGGLDVLSYHVANLLIHLLAALALFGVVRRTLRLPALEGRFGRASTGLATAVALIWALHPLQTESVTYIVQRAESLMGLCFLLTLYCVIRSATSARPWPWRAAAVIACALGMGAKEVMVGAPIVVLLYDRAFLSGSFRETFRKRGALYLGLAATWALLAATLHTPAAAGFGLKTVTPWRYAITQTGVILRYLALSFWPASLCLDYSLPFATKLWAWPVAVEALALLALLAATVWACVRRPALGFLGAWFFLILAPTSSIMPIEDACYEHRMYLSLAAVVVGAVVAAHWLIRRLTQKWEWPDKSATLAAAALVMAASVALGGLTFVRNRVYRSEISMWEDVAAKRPENARVWSNLGACYLLENRFDDALRCYDRAVALKHPDAYYNRALAFSAMKDRAGAIRDFTAFIATKPDPVKGDLLFKAYLYRGDEYFAIHRYSAAAEDFTSAIALKPDSEEPYFKRANAYGALGMYDLALADCSRAIALEPTFARAWRTRAMIHFTLKDYDDARRDMEEFQKRGGKPDPAFLQALKRAVGRSE